MRRSSKPHVAVLLYHHIGKPRPNPAYLSLTVTPRQFQRQIQWLHWRGYTPISCAQWITGQKEAGSLPNKPIILTFDDAYSDLATHAFPVLERYGFPSVVFAITGHAKGGSFWEGLPTMTMEQLRHWSTRGVEIGAHTRSHPDLTTISDLAASEEVVGSREDLNDAGLPPLSFAYPFGAFDARSRRLVDGSFEMAFTCEEGLNDPATDPLLLKRTMVHPGDNLIDIEFRAAFGRSPLDWLRTHGRLRSRIRKAFRRLKSAS